MVDVRFKGCKITDSRLEELTGNELRIEDTILEVRASLSESSIPMTFRKCTLDGVELSGPTFKNSQIAKTYVRDAYVTRFALGNMGQVHVENSTMHRSGFFQGGIEEFSVSNSTIDEIVGKNFKADIVLWDNVTLDGKIDLTNAQVKDFRPTRLKRGLRLQLITTGSNMRF
jgi:hypothetical protein